MKPYLGLLLLLNALLSANLAHAFEIGFEASEGYVVGSASGQPSGGAATFLADPPTKTIPAVGTTPEQVIPNPRFNIVAAGGVGNGQALQMGSVITKNFESLLIPLRAADYGASTGLPNRLFRIGASIKRFGTLNTRYDPDFTFEWGSAGDFRMVKLRASAKGELLVYEANRMLPTVIPEVFAGGATSPYRRFEAVVNFPYRTYRLFIDGVAQLGGRDILFGTVNDRSSPTPLGALQIGFSASVLGNIYLIDNFTCAVEPAAPIIPEPVSNRPDDGVALPAGSSLPINIGSRTGDWKPSEYSRREFLGGIDTNWYLAYRNAYVNLPSITRADNTVVPRLGEELIDSNLKLPPHPRLFFPDLPKVSGKTPLQVLQERAASPAFAVVTDQIKRQGANLLTMPFPPVLTTGKLEAEDPGRGMSDTLDWLGLAYIIEADTSKKAALQARLKSYVSWMLDKGNFVAELPLGEETSSLSRTYDWFYNDFLAQDLPLRKRLKYGIADRVRFRSDYANRVGSGRSAQGAPIFNHAWFSTLGPGAAGLALWGDDDADLPAAEIRKWLTEAFNHFAMQQACMPSDGGTIEGWSYEAYGAHAVYDFVTQADPLLGLGGQLLDNDHNRNRAQRVYFYSPLLSDLQLMRYGDGFIQGAGGGSVYHYLAARYRDPSAQLLGNNMMAQATDYWPLFGNWGTGNDYWPNHWRSLFWYDPTLTPATFSDLPLFKNGNDYGLCSARSNWSPNATGSAISFGCGLNAGREQLKVWGGKKNFDDHRYPAIGNVVFFDGSTEILPTTEWNGVKWTGYYNCALFAPRDGQLAINGNVADVDADGNPVYVPTNNVLIGQLNENNDNVPLTFSPPYTDNYRAPRIIHQTNTADLHAWLMEFGAQYVLTDNRNNGTANGATKANRKTTYPTYFRRVVYLPQRNVAIVADRIRTFYGRQPVYNVPTRFLNPVLTTTSPGQGTLDFTQLTNCPVKSGKQATVDYDGRLVFFSPTSGTAALDTTEVPTARDFERQNLRYSISADVSDSSFGFAVGKKSNLAGLTFAITGGRLVITGLAGGDQSFALTDDEPLPPQAVEAPVCSPGAGPFTGTKSVTLTSATTGASIRYTLDDTLPSETTGTLYTGTFQVTSTTVVRAIGFKTGQPASPVTRAVFTSITPPPTPTSAPAAPTDLTTSGATTTGVTVSWSDRSDNETGFSLERGSGTNPAFSEIAKLAANATSFNDSGLNPKSLYNYRIKATNSAGDSAYSNIASMTTKEVPVSDPPPTGPNSGGTAGNSGGGGGGGGCGTGLGLIGFMACLWSCLRLPRSARSGRY